MVAFLWDVIIVDSLEKNDQFFSFQTTQLSLFVLLFDIWENAECLRCIGMWLS